MKLYGRCKNCTKDVVHHTKAQDRSQMTLKNQDPVALRCNYCHNVHSYRAERLYARPSTLLMIVAGSILVLGLPLLIISVYVIGVGGLYLGRGFLIGGIGIPGFIYYKIHRWDQNRVRKFNRSGKVRNL
ncbi:MAG: hypothetical protein WBA16_12535 [Nonlabens sp.]